MRANFNQMCTMIFIIDNKKYKDKKIPKVDGDIYD